LRKSQTRYFEDLNNLLYLRTFQKCGSLWICDLWTQSFCGLPTSAVQIRTKLITDPALGNLKSTTDPTNTNPEHWHLSTLPKKGVSFFTLQSLFTVPESKGGGFGICTIIGHNSEGGVAWGPAHPSRGGGAEMLHSAPSSHLFFLA
jgi:hypothetical protein